MYTMISALLVLAGVISGVRAAVPPPVPVPVGPPKGPTPPPAAAAGPIKYPALLAFGDSIIDTGNNNYIRTIVRANFPPYGRDFPGHKATGRFSDGRISVDFLAAALGVKENLPPYLRKDLTLDELKTGVSFASAGSGYDNATCRTMSALTMEQQLKMFLEYKAKVGTIPDKALYLMVWGSNDVIEHFTFGDPMSVEQYSDLMAQRAISFIQSLVSLGAKTIAVTGAPPVGCVPSQRILAGGIRRQCSPDRNQLALMFNNKVKQRMAALGPKLPGVKLIFIDLYAIFEDVIQRHEALGFKNAKDSCCGFVGLAVAVLCNFASPVCAEPDKYIFWDSYHPSTSAYKVIMDMVVEKYFKY
ncbi:hypothetical protein ZWY2020_057069 [Hordeum vulgare]|nr:hypothetical protein ZWY2020_057069 [Hordeum vulgare]